ncbi:nitronate monooxygenase [Streptomyces spinosus]|uniref:nitronate monooxygenase n=1 Tax=Streptomyces spinosus TaxID=2872623 RepID=UPI001CEC60FD
MADSAFTATTVTRAFTTTTVTRAFTGRPARALGDHFTDRFDASPRPATRPRTTSAPLRKAATAAGDTRPIRLWAGTGHREARTESAADPFACLAVRMRGRG